MKLSEIKVHTIRNPAIEPMGAPKNPARVFDKPGTNRSALQRTKDFQVLKGEIDWHDWSDEKNDELSSAGGNYAIVHVIRGAIDDKGIENNTYRGITVILPMDRTKFEFTDGGVDFSSSDGQADLEVKKYPKEILAAVVKALKANDIDGMRDKDRQMDYPDGEIGGINNLTVD